MPRLGRFNVFIGETDAIDSFLEAAIKTGDCGIWDTENIQDYNIVDTVSNVRAKYERGILDDTLKVFGIVIKTKNEIGNKRHHTGVKQIKPINYILVRIHNFWVSRSPSML